MWRPAGSGLTDSSKVCGLATWIWQVNGLLQPTRYWFSDRGEGWFERFGFVNALSNLHQCFIKSLHPGGRM